MARTTKSDIQNAVNTINNLTDKNYKDRMWNGYHHIIDDKGVMLCSGTAKEVVDFMWAYRLGIQFEREKG